MQKKQILLVASIVWLVLVPFWDAELSALSDSIVGPQLTFVLDKNLRFVAVNGSDNNPGTAHRPWATINHAADTSPSRRNNCRARRAL